MPLNTRPLRIDFPLDTLCKVSGQLAANTLQDGSVLKGVYVNGPDGEPTLCAEEDLHPVAGLRTGGISNCVAIPLARPSILQDVVATVKTYFSDVEIVPPRPCKRGREGQEQGDCPVDPSQLSTYTTDLLIKGGVKVSLGPGNLSQPSVPSSAPPQVATQEMNLNPHIVTKAVVSWRSHRFTDTIADCVIAALTSITLPSTQLCQKVLPALLHVLAQMMFCLLRAF